MSKIGEIIVGALLPVLGQVGVEQLANVLRKVEPDKTRHDLLRSLYRPIDTILEDYTDSTKSKIDNVFVDTFKGAIEAIAAEDGIDLYEKPENETGSTEGKPSIFVADPGNNS